ncbi:MAG: outer membrane beta-barrel protein [Melioribacteraceae bacterium]|nr:outer membrane beta-barrel protein [Melioribacteraceae bacterium]
MKKLMIFVVVFLSTVISAQNDYQETPFSNTGFGLYGGINAVTGSETGGAVLLNFHANLISNLNLELSVGYSKIHENVSYTLKKYYITQINNNNFFSTADSHINTKWYNVIPLSAGFQYLLYKDTFSPYLVANVSYNWIIETKEFSDITITTSYPSQDAIPAEYKEFKWEPELTHSTGINAGFGVLYKLSSKINLDFRYLYRSDSDLVDIHQFLIGITI